MIIEKAEFVTSSARMSDCPKTKKPEFAFIGRSNVGKSSLINMLTERKKLARISATPGKTQLINHYLINEKWYLVDMPGYGYAKLSKMKRKGFSILIENYILERENLVTLFVLIDANIPPQQSDLEFTEWLGVKGIPFSIVYTKTDKPNQKKLRTNLKKFREKMLTKWEEMPPEFITSTVKKTGKEELLRYIGEYV
ncbi:MAG: ribosome biogenesis GTP-binding protein YihA/YsxC [Bacteroidota bacterium]